MGVPERTARDAGTGLLSPKAAGTVDPLDPHRGGGGQPYIQERRRSVDEPMFVPVDDWVIAVHARNPDTGEIIQIPLRRAQRVTPGFYMRRHDETGVWLEPLATAGESDG